MEQIKTNETYVEKLHRKLEDLFGSEKFTIEPLEGGTNNLLKKVKTHKGKVYVAKSYFSDGRRRLEREYDLLTVLREKGIEEVPTPVARFDDLYSALYTFVEGKHLSATEFTDHELELMATYLNKLQSISPKEVTQLLDAGFTSAFSLAEIEGLIVDRMKPFQDGAENVLDPRISRFIAETQVLAKVERAIIACRERFVTRMDHQLANEHKRLSSVDFGPHNMLWGVDGSLAVLDFEYGGWDHPLRVIGDMLAGDKMRDLTDRQKEYLLERYLAGTSLPNEVTCDLSAFCAFSEIEWAMIFMTSLLPAKIARLQHAKGSGYDLDAYLEEQMQKIADRLERLERTGFVDIR